MENIKLLNAMRKDDHDQLLGKLNKQAKQWAIFGYCCAGLIAVLGAALIYTLLVCS